MKIRTIVFLPILIGIIFASAPLFAQQDTVYRASNRFVLISCYVQKSQWQPGVDSIRALEQNDPAIVGFQDQIQAAYFNAKYNPFLDLLSEFTFKNISQEYIIYFESQEDPAAYDSIFIDFNKYGGSKPNLTIFYLNTDGHWEPIAVDSTKTKIDKTGFYALFSKKEEFGFSVYGISSYKNPFDPIFDGGCHICYILRENSEVDIRVFSQAGDEVFRKTCNAGEEGGIGSETGSYLNRIFWDGRNKKGRIVDNGGYLCRIKLKDQDVKTWKIGVIR